MKFTFIIAVLGVVTVYIANVSYICPSKSPGEHIIDILFIYGLFNKDFTILDFIWSELANN
jgi:hypothetical protein